MRKTKQALNVVVDLKVFLLIKSECQRKECFIVYLDFTIKLHLIQPVKTSEMSFSPDRALGWTIILGATPDTILTGAKHIINYQ